MIKNKNPLLASVLNIFPGTGMIYIGKYKKGFSLLIITIGVTLTLIFSRSYVILGLMIMIYVVTVIPSTIESYQLAKYGKNKLNTGAKWYVVLLLLTTGFSALPLMWQSESFARLEKIVWSIAVPVLAIIFFTSLAWVGPQLDGYLEDRLGKLAY